MSIEKNIERIADALEKLALGALNPLRTVEATPAPKAPVADAMPGEETTTGVVMTGAELRELAQKYLQASGDKANSLVAFIKDSICKKFSPKEPKLIKIPEDKTAEAAAMIVAWSKKNGVSLPIEV